MDFSPTGTRLQEADHLDRWQAALPEPFNFLNQILHEVIDDVLLTASVQEAVKKEADSKPVPDDESGAAGGGIISGDKAASKASRFLVVDAGSGAIGLKAGTHVCHQGFMNVPCTKGVTPHGMI